MAKPNDIDLPSGEKMSIVYEDRSALAVDKPPGWMLAPESWQHTSRNLHTTLLEAIHARAFWAKVRRLKYLRFVHRLDADTSGVLLLAKSPGALRALSELFESRAMEKTYLAVVQGRPKETEWTCDLRLAPDAKRADRMVVNSGGKPAETRFRLLANAATSSLVDVRPLTGRTHQIRVHLAVSGYPVLNDELYGAGSNSEKNLRSAHPWLALRAVSLGYTDPFTRRRVRIDAPTKEFLQRYGFERAVIGGAATRDSGPKRQTIENG